MLNRIASFIPGIFSEEEIDYLQEPRHQPAIQHPLLAAAEQGDLVLISHIINLAPNMQVKDAAGNTPLILAAAANQLAAVRVLLNNGALLEARGNNGCTALHAAAYMGREEIVAYLAEQEADLNTKTDNGALPLSLAITNGHVGVVLALAEAGADVNMTDQNQSSLLMHAVKCGRADIVEILLQARANPQLVDHQGRTAATLAVARGRNDILELLHRSEFVLAAMEINEQQPVIAAPDMVMPEADTDDVEDDPLIRDYICPISQAVIKDPVTAPSGITYDRESLRDWFASQGNPDELADPTTRGPMPVAVLSFGTNIAIKKEIEDRVKQVKEKQRAGAQQQLAPLSPQDEVRARRVEYFAGQSLFRQPNPVPQNKTNAGLAVTRPSRLW